MGSPLAPVLANIFMGFHESKWLNEYNLIKPKFYLRYVDDILAAFDNEQDSLNFFNFLNNRHPNIIFTIEKQNNHSIAFLDVFISGIKNQNLTLQTYYKSTYTGLLLNFKSFTSFSYKISLIKCLIDRSYAGCSSSYIGKTCHHFKTRIEEDIKKDNKSHTFKHLHSSETSFGSYSSLCFKIIDKANSKFDLKIKEALHINWRKPNLNAQQNHLALTLSL